MKQVSCVHHVLQETTKEDIRTIWEIVGDVQMVHDHNENFRRRDGEKAWRRLEQDLTEEKLLRDFEEKTNRIRSRM